MASSNDYDNNDQFLEISKDDSGVKMSQNEKVEINLTSCIEANIYTSENSNSSLKKSLSGKNSGSEKSTLDCSDSKSFVCSTQSPSLDSDSNNQWESPPRESDNNHEYEKYEESSGLAEPISGYDSNGRVCKRKRNDSFSSLSSFGSDLGKSSETNKPTSESNLFHKILKCKTQKLSNLQNADDNDNSVHTSEEEIKDDVESNLNDLNNESNSIEMNCNQIEFQVLDDIEESDTEHGDVQQSNFSDSELDGEDEFPVEDVDAMLEEDLPESFKDSSKGESVVKVKRKVILEEIGQDHFDVLPEGWIQIMHSSGMPVYLHQKSRVCTMSRPYFLGPGSSRNHQVPLSGIPCLQYRKALDLELKKKEEEEKHYENNKNQPDIQLMSAKVETFEENDAFQSLEAPELRKYCEKIFKFKTVSLLPFKSWADRKKYVRMIKDSKRKQRPSLPGDTKLLKFTVHNTGENPREWIINPNGKSHVCILHEYVQHALKNHPKYEFKELANRATPYSATVLIGDMKYGVGLGASKKQAKNEAAKATLEVLIPEIRDTIRKDENVDASADSEKGSQNNAFSIFDQIRIEDPRVAEFCAKTTEPPPYAILLTCLSRNMGLGEIQVHYEMNPKKHKEDEFTLTVGNHKATVLCKNKREGKQRAAQAILQALHPNIKHWGSLLRMYGNKSVKSVKEKKQEEQQITSLQSNAAPNQPNNAILSKLKEEMLKLREKRFSVKAKGKFIPPDNVLPSLSSTDLCQVNLN